MIIDAHAHIYPDKISDKAVKNVGDFYLLGMQCGGTVQELLSIGKSAGIDRFLVHSPALSAARVRSINDYISQECRIHPELIGFGTLHADMENPEIEISRMKSLGLKGIKIHPDSQRFHLDDPRMMSIYRILEAEKLPVLFHTGDYRYDYSHPRRLVHVMHTYPNLVCIASHYGGWSIYDLAMEFLRDESCYLDMSSSFAFLGMQRAKELIELYTPGRMLFGSDFPMWNPGSELDLFHSMGFSKAEEEAMCYSNIMTILNP